MAHIHLDRIALTCTGTLTSSLSLSALFGRWRGEARYPILREVGLTIVDGERVALVGPDGAGKSALLRVLAGLQRPESGSMIVEGAVLHLADILQQIDPDATGWENIDRRLSAGSEAKQLAEFTGLGEFLDLPVRCFSTGMRWRLGFSLATAREAEVLLVDDVCGGGDLAFRARAEDRLRRLIDGSRIAIVASHDLEALAQLCRRAVWLESGRVREVGPVESILERYRSAQPALAG
jgi:ABC-type polysaccharide/polyol phosphate transport system ATPase subunit